MSDESARGRLIEQLRARGITDARVLAAIERIDRAQFVPRELTERAFEDTSLPIGQDQTISQPTVVGMMTQALRLSGAERVLDVGTGSGYQAAVLCELAAEVVTVERVAELRERAATLLHTLGYRNVTVHAAGETLGWPAAAPYDGIVVSAGGPTIPPSLIQQLVVGGSLVMPVGALNEQRLLLAVRTPDAVELTDLGRVRFVPLIGQGGWPEDTRISEPPAPDDSSA